MTAEDYRKALVQARDNWPKLTAPTKRKIRAAYVKAGRDIAEVLRNGTLVDGQLDAATQRAFDQAVLVASSEIAEAMRTEIPAMILTGALALSAIEAELLTSSFGGVFGRGVTPEGIARAFDKVARDTVTKSLSTILDDGYNFWGRVPNVSRDFGDDVVNLVRAAIDQGRDLGKIAADVNVYIKDGKAFTIKRWGENLAPRSSELLRRIRFDRVDYRALRLVRSEFGRGLMEEGKEFGTNNPACSGWFDWVRVNTIEYGCECPANAAGSPYLLENFPPYAHPNCGCMCRPVLKNLTDFKRDLRAWVNGEPNAELDGWITGTYRSA